MTVEEFIAEYFKGRWELMGGLSRIELGRREDSWIHIVMQYKLAHRLRDDVKDEIGLTLVDLIERYGSRTNERFLELLDMIFDDERRILTMIFKVHVPFGLRALDVINAILVEMFENLFVDWSSEERKL